MYKIYQVEYGDTIDRIANKTNTTPKNIRDINGINNDSELVVGSLIIVPKEFEKSFDIYKVKKGDSIYSIAKMYNVDPETLLLLNGLSKNDYIYPEQEIYVPQKDTLIYITKEGDTLSAVADNLGVDLDTLNKENERVFIVEDQLIIHNTNKR